MQEDYAAVELGEQGGRGKRGREENPVFVTIPDLAGSLCHEPTSNSRSEHNSSPLLESE